MVSTPVCASLYALLACATCGVFVHLGFYWKPGATSDGICSAARSDTFKCQFIPTDFEYPVIDNAKFMSEDGTQCTCKGFTLARPCDEGSLISHGGEEVAKKVLNGEKKDCLLTEHGQCLEPEIKNYLSSLSTTYLVSGPMFLMGILAWAYIHLRCCAASANARIALSEQEVGIE